MQGVTKETREFIKRHRRLADDEGHRARGGRANAIADFAPGRVRTHDRRGCDLAFMNQHRPRLRRKRWPWLLAPIVARRHHPRATTFNKKTTIVLLREIPGPHVAIRGNKLASARHKETHRREVRLV